MTGNGGATAIGVDLGGTHLRAARVSQAGVLLVKTVEPISRDPETVVQRLLALCGELDSLDVAAAGIGIPGRVDARRRIILSGGYVDLSRSHLAERLQEALRKPVWIDNDCNMALLGESAAGAANGEPNIVMLTIGTGIGGAVALDGQLVRGRAAAGQFGHVTVAQDGVRCACGRSGCVETTSSGTALRRLIAAAGLPESTRAEALLDAVEAGDPTAGNLVAQWIGPLRDVIDSLVACFDPGLVLLGGGLGQAAHRALAQAPPRSSWYRCRIEAARLGDDAGLIGAGLTALLSRHLDRSGTAA